MVSVTCPCGRIKAEKRCATVTSNTNNNNLLKCDDECTRLERNRALAAALHVNIDPETTTSATLVPYSNETLNAYQRLAASSTIGTIGAIQSYETTLQVLAANPAQKTARFPPVKAPVRAFIHSLAADWGFASESHDAEPQRHVEVHRPGRWVGPPVPGIAAISVAEAVHRRERERERERDEKTRAREERARAREAERIEAEGNGGWAQVARKGGPNNNVAATVGVNGSVDSNRLEMKNNDGGVKFGEGRFGALVLSTGRRKKETKETNEAVADSWEQEIDADLEMEQGFDDGDGGGNDSHTSEHAV